MDKNVIPKSTKQKGPLIKVALVGDSEVGKTSIINTFINESPPKENFKKSVGIDSVMKYLVVNNNPVRLEIWDTAGEDKLRTMISTYYRGAAAILIVYDYTNFNSFYSLKNWIREVKQFAPEKCVKYLVCNKIDKISPDTTAYSNTNWIINEEEVENFAKVNTMKLVRVSAFNNTGIQDLFLSVAEDVVNSMDSETIKIRSESFKIQLINGEIFNVNKQNKKGYNMNNFNRRESDCCY